MNRNTSVLAAVALAALAAGPCLDAEQLTFRGPPGYSYTVTASPGPGGYSVTTTSERGINDSSTDEGFSTLRCAFRDPSADTEIRLVRSHNCIQVEGTVKGRRFHKTHSIDEDPWYQEWGLGLRSFVLGAEKRHAFWSINPSDPNMIAKFEANRSAEETLVVNGEEVEAVRLKVSLPGLLAAFFSADYWFRRSDGVLIRVLMPGRAGKPQAIVDLAAVEP
jgi:hypothetical protein